MTFDVDAVAEDVPSRWPGGKNQSHAIAPARPGALLVELLPRRVDSQASPRLPSLYAPDYHTMYVHLLFGLGAKGAKKGAEHHPFALR